MGNVGIPTRHSIDLKGVYKDIGSTSISIVVATSVGIYNVSLPEPNLRFLAVCALGRVRRLETF